MIFVTLEISLIFYTIQLSTTNEGWAFLISCCPPSERASLPETVGAVVRGPADSPPCGERERGGRGGGGGAADRNLGVLKSKEGRGAQSLP